MSGLKTIVIKENAWQVSLKPFFLSYEAGFRDALYSVTASFNGKEKPLPQTLLAKIKERISSPKQYGYIDNLLGADKRPIADVAPSGQNCIKIRTHGFYLSKQSAVEALNRVVPCIEGAVRSWLTGVEITPEVIVALSDIEHDRQEAAKNKRIWEEKVNTAETQAAQIVADARADAQPAANKVLADATEEAACIIRQAKEKAACITRQAEEKVAAHEARLNQKESESTLLATSMTVGGFMGKQTNQLRYQWLKDNLRTYFSIDLRLSQIRHLTASSSLTLVCTAALKYMSCNIKPANDPKSTGYIKTKEMVEKALDSRSFNASTLLQEWTQRDWSRLLWGSTSDREESRKSISKMAIEALDACNP